MNNTRSFRAAAALPRDCDIEIAGSKVNASRTITAHRREKRELFIRLRIIE
jgi:hypothetical protein